jgi:hypothetical protein
MEAMIDAQDPQLAMLDAISEAVDDVPWSTYTADQLKAVEAIRDAQDPMRAHNRYVEELKVLVKDAGLTEQEFTLAVQASRDALMEKNEVLEESQTLLQEYADEASNVNDRLQEVATGGVRSLENSLLDLAKGTKSAAEAFKSMANSIVDDITRMAIKQQITGPLSGMLNTAIGSMFTPATGFNGAFGGDMSFAGGGFTGRGARSGGVDGKGGFPAVLHPNETVVDHTKGQQTGGASVVQNFNITTGVQQTVRAEIMNMMPQIAEAAKAAVADGKQRGGSYSAAFA